MSFFGECRLSADFINAHKMTYQHRQIEFIVQDVQDETEYFMSSPANHENLSRAIENLPEAQKKRILRNLDDSIKANASSDLEEQQ